MKFDEFIDLKTAKAQTEYKVGDKFALSKEAHEKQTRHICSGRLDHCFVLEVVSVSNDPIPEVDFRLKKYPIEKEAT